MGVTQATLNAAKRLMADLPDDVRKLSVNQAKRVYERLYWQPVVDALPADAPFGVKFQLFDAYVNHSPQAVWKMVQRVVRATPDGVLGPQTRMSLAFHIDEYGGLSFAVSFLAERGDYYTTLSNWPSFGKGWTDRLANNLRYAAKDLT